MITFNVDETTGQELLRIARQTVSSRLLKGSPPTWNEGDPGLKQPAGAFVTIRRDGHLRGCIGNFDATMPIAVMVMDMARAAAFQDPRFEPVAAEELDLLRFDISILGPRFPIRPEEVIVGTHGLNITRGRRRGVLLPQVPVEWGWDRETFLDEVCLKAGLPEGTWREPDVLLEAFTAVVLREED